MGMLRIGYGYGLLLLLCVLSGCTETVKEIPLNRVEIKNITTVAILTPISRPNITMDTTSDDMFLMMLFSGPAIVAQLMNQVAAIDMRRQENKRFNALTYDTHVGHMLREDLYNKLKQRASFRVISPDEVDDNFSVYKLENKPEKTQEDYETIAQQLGADTLIELDVLICGVKDPGILAKPHSLIIAKVAMIRARGKEVLWQTKLGQAISQEKKIGFDSEKYQEDNAKLLKEELDTLSSMLAEQILEALGFESRMPTAQLLREPPLKSGNP
ncbi:MAG: hypothetical protein V3V45_08930 [Candidatus Brocadiales bacterium]